MISTQELVRACTRTNREDRDRPPVGRKTLSAQFPYGPLRSSRFRTAAVDQADGSRIRDRLRSRRFTIAFNGRIHDWVRSSDFHLPPSALRPLPQVRSPDARRPSSVLRSALPFKVFLRPPSSALRPASVGFVRQLVKSRMNAKIQPNINICLVLCLNEMIIDFGFVRRILNICESTRLQPTPKRRWVRSSITARAAFVRQNQPPADAQPRVSLPGADHHCL